MRKLALLCAAAGAMIATPASATYNHDLRGRSETTDVRASSNSSSNSTSHNYNAANAAGGAGGSANATGGAGGSANATGGAAVANGGFAAGGHATGGSVTNSSTNNASNEWNSSNTASANNNGSNNGNNNSSSSNYQEQSQTQSISNQSDSSNSNNSSQDVSVNSYHQRAPVSTAFAAPLMTSEDTCMGSSSLGAQAITFGLSIGTTWRDENCQRLKNSRQLVALGYVDAATALICADRDVRRAMEQAGTPCPSGDNRRAQLQPTAAVVAPAPAPAAPPCPAANFAVYFDWDRSNLTPDAIATIDAAVARARQCNIDGTLVIGHTDTSGSDHYNNALSRRRASVVRDALIDRGVPVEIISTEARGERELARLTGDGVREGLNRRTAVVITFR